MTSTSHYDVMISSTSRDLESYRKAAQDAVFRCNLFPQMMEKDEAVSDTPLDYSLRLVDISEAYIGIFAHRYGHIPSGADVSITEMEYRRAVERGIPILIFIVAEHYHFNDSASETTLHSDEDSEKRTKLSRLLDELKAKHVVSFFTTPEDLKNKVFQSLTALKESGSFGTSPITTTKSIELPPKPPKPYFAHPSSLPRAFVGRTTELEKLNSWAQSTDTTFILQALGGAGKTTLAWYWVTQQAQAQIPNLAGIIWWSFYESDGSMRNFMRHALSYINHQTLDELNRLSREEIERMLLLQLRRSPYLIVFDGLERLMIAYHRMDAPMMGDSDDEASSQSSGAHLRSLVDPNHDLLLRNIAESAPTKLLINTRLVPHILQERYSPALRRGIQHEQITGIYPPSEAIQLMRNLGVKGPTDSILNFTNQFGNHALLLHIFAGLVVNYRPAPGDFVSWFSEHGRKLSIADLDISQRQTGILEFALDGLDPMAKLLQQRIASFRYPASYEAVIAISPYDEIEVLSTHEASERLNAGLTELEDRGLLLWDRVSNHYSMHPVVRNIAFSQMPPSERKHTFTLIRRFFENELTKEIANATDVGELQSYFEIYFAYIGGGETAAALRFYRREIGDVLMFRLSAYDMIVKLLKPFHPDVLAELPEQPEQDDLSYAYNEIGWAYIHLGYPDEAHRIWHRKIDHTLQNKNTTELCLALLNYAVVLDQMGHLAESQVSFELGMEVAQAANYDNGIAWAHMDAMQRAVNYGDWQKAEAAYSAFQSQPPSHQTDYWLAEVEALHTCMQIMRNVANDQDIANRLQQIQQSNNTQALQRLHHWCGVQSLQKSEASAALDHFDRAVKIARQSGSSELSLSIGGLAEAQLKLGNTELALDYLQEALNLGAKIRPGELYCSAAAIYMAINRQDDARQYAMNAYKHAWHAGRPYSYWFSLKRSTEIIALLTEEDPNTVHRKLGLEPFTSVLSGNIVFSEQEIKRYIEDLRTTHQH